MGWRADGISRALAAGGVPLETYRKPGFTGTKGVRRSDTYGGGFGFDIDLDPELDDFYDRKRDHPQP